MAGFNNDVVYANNVRFDGGEFPGLVVADGQLLIGNAVFPNIRVGTLTSPGGTITIGYVAPNITIDVAGGGVPIDSIQVDAATGPGVNPVVPDGAGLMTVSGVAVAAATIPIRTHTNAVNSYRIEVQRASVSAVTNATQQGLASFNSAHFTVDVNGFVSSIVAPIVWLESAGGLLLVQTGYFANAAAVYTLPAAPLIGQIVEIIDNIGGGVVVTANAGQTIRIQNIASSVAGTATSTQMGDALRLVYRAANTEWQCCPGGGGNWILA